ncbi:MAG: hypothetical protein ACI8PZ_006030 [Myxococcota bacterium]|jgi:hypothetical protein
MRWFVLLLLGCGGGAPEVADDCVNGDPCEIGQVCVAGTCRVADCTGSEACPFGEYCDIAQYTCAEGCQTDTDCLAEDECSGGVCNPRDCLETQRDCPLMSFCEKGDCEGVNTQDWCGVCDTPSDCDDTFTCVQFDPDSPYGSWCATECDSDEECPSGLSCLTLDFGGGELRSICYTDCALLYENGLIE